MAIKEVITKEEFDALQKPMQVLYPHINEDGTYGLDLEGRVDTSALLNGKRRVSEENKNLKAERDRLLAEKKLLDEEKARILAEAENKGKKVEEDVTKKVQKEIDDLKKQFNTREEKLRTSATKSEIKRLAGSMNGQWLNDEIGQIVLEKRIKVVADGDDIKTIFLDKNGQETDMNFEEFQKSIVDEPAIKAILKANNASGGGASNSADGNQPLEFSKMTALEKAKLAKENPALYLKLRTNSKTKK